MGSQVVAKCECGVKESIFVGGGMKSFMTTCLFPCLCESCHSIVEANLLAEERTCPKCQAPNPIPYDDPRLQETAGQRRVVEWDIQNLLGRILVLNNGRYRCPKCGNQSLQFELGDLCWD